MLPWKPIVSVIKGKYFVMKNEKSHNSIKQIDTQKSLTFSGITSEMTKIGMLKMAIEAMNMTNEKLMTGTQLNASIETPHDFSIM